MSTAISRRAALMAGLALAGAAALPESAAFADQVAAGPLPLRYRQDFESGMDSWTPASDHRERAYHIGLSKAFAYSGVFSLEYFLNGLNDDGTIWVERRFTGLPPKALVGVTTSFYLYSDVQSRVTTWPVVAYAGGKEPSLESDFTIVGHTNRVAGWAPYGQKALTQVDDTGGLWVAVGIGATWEVSRTYYIDLIDVLIESTTGIGL